jgi:hypothetical protein
MLIAPGILHIRDVDGHLSPLGHRCSASASQKIRDELPTVITDVFVPP